MGHSQQRSSVIVSVINDLSTDQRVRRSCEVLHNLGFRVTLVGRQMPGSPTLPDRPYRMKRFRLPVNKGPVFYALFNLRLFLMLLFRKPDLLYANDLDTLMPNAMVGMLKRIPVVFDSHELFTEVPELAGRPVARNTWRWIERMFIRKAERVITVNRSFAEIFSDRYGISAVVVRNIPESFRKQTGTGRTNLGLPSDKRILILQGSGINVQRGAEEAVLAMRYLPGCLLVIAGSGDVIEILKAMVQEYNLDERVRFLPRQSYVKLMQYTACADLGLSLDKDTNLNYRYSLPNKLFDYIQAGIPVLVSDLPEVARIVREYQLGEVLEDHDPKGIAEKVEGMFADEKRYRMWKSNTREAAALLNWETESKILADTIRDLLK